MSCCEKKAERLPIIWHLFHQNKNKVFPVILRNRTSVHNCLCLYVPDTELFNGIVFYLCLCWMIIFPNHLYWVTFYRFVCVWEWVFNGTKYTTTGQWATGPLAFPNSNLRCFRISSSIMPASQQKFVRCLYGVNWSAVSYDLYVGSRF